MGQLSVGEDLFAALTAVGLVLLFAAALAYSYHAYAERRNFHEGLDLALDIADQLKNNVLAKHDNIFCPGLINPKTFEVELPGYGRLLTKQGISLRVEVRGLDGKLMLAYGSEPNWLGGYFSPPCSVALPVAIAQAPPFRPLGELIVRVWR